MRYFMIKIVLYKKFMISNQCQVPIEEQTDGGSNKSDERNSVVWLHWRTNFK